MTSVRTLLGMSEVSPPLGKRDVWGWLGFSAIGLVIILLSSLEKIISPSLRGEIFLVCIAAFFAISAFGRRKSSGSQAASTVGAENQKQIKSRLAVHVVLVVAFALGFTAWARHLGLAWPIVISALLFIEALPNLVVSLSDWWRLSGVGLSLICIVIGVCLPLVPVAQAGLLIGGAIMAGSLLSAGILWWQIKLS